MEAREELKRRLQAAFSRYSVEDARFRNLKAALPTDADSAMIHGINAQWQAFAAADREYKLVRLEYAGCLLSGANNDLLSAAGHAQLVCAALVVVGHLPSATVDRHAR